MINGKIRTNGYCNFQNVKETGEEARSAVLMATPFTRSWFETYSRYSIVSLGKTPCDICLAILASNSKLKLYP